jgi:acyl-CoA synthetase (AMP-forming)/AMP-acid ligase II
LNKKIAPAVRGADFPLQLHAEWPGILRQPWRLPLGRPNPIYQLRLRDEEGAEVARGEIGEICVAGPSVTIGYSREGKAR